LSSSTDAVAPPVLPAVTVSLQALMPSFAAAQTLLTTLLAMWDSSETGAAGALVIVLQEAKLAMAAPYGFIAPGALLDAEAVFMWHAEAPSPAKKAATNATAAPVSPMRNITATVTFSGLTPTQWGVIGGGVRGKVNESAPLVIAFRTELAAKLALPAPFVAGNITITGITAVFNTTTSASGRRLLAAPAKPPAGPATPLAGTAVAFQLRVNTSTVNATAVNAAVLKTLATNGTFAAGFKTGYTAAFTAANATRSVVTIIAVSVSTAANVSLNTTAPPGAAAAAAALKAARAGKALEGLLSDSSKAVVIAVCVITGVFLGVAVTWTTVQARKRHQALLKLNSVGSD
jgi:hypothetical protein